MKGFLKFLIISLILISAVLVPLNVWLKTSSAQEQLALLVEEIITDQLGIDVKISGLKLSLPLIVRANNISFSEQGKETIIIKNFYINILPSLFSFWEINIWSLSAEELRILQSPTIKTKDNNNSSSGLFNPNIIIQEANIAKIILDKALTNQEEEFIISLDSHLEFNSDKQQLHFAIINQLLSQKSLLGDNIVEILGSYDIKKDKTDINSLKINSDLVKIDGEFFMDKSADQISGKIIYNSNVLEPFISKSFEGATSNIAGNLKISGKASAPHITTSGDFLINLPPNDYFKFPSLSWDTDMIVSEDGIDGNINITQQDLAANGNLGYKNNKLYLKNFKALASNFEKTAHLIFDTERSILTGKVSVTDTTLQTSSSILPFLQSGAIALNIVYSASDNATQQMTAKGQIKQLYTKFGNCGLVDIDLNIGDLWNLKLAPSKLDIAALDINNITLKHVAFNMLSNDNGLQIDGSVLANQPYPIDLKFSTELVMPTEPLNITISNLAGTIGSVPVKNSTNILLVVDKQTSFELNNFIIGGGFINATAELGETNIVANTELKNIPMRILPSFLPSSFKEALGGGMINLSGTRTKPTITANLEIGDIIVPNSPNKYTLKLSTNILNNKTNITGEFLEETQKIANLSATLPSKFSLSPFEYNINEQEYFLANLHTVKSFNLLSMLPMAPGSTLAGYVNADINASGSLNSPKLTGNMMIADGNYKYKQYGLLLKDINAQATASGQQIIFKTITAKDNFNNQLTASGSASLDQEKTFNLMANLDKFNLMNTPYLQGEITGNLVIKGDKNSATSKGNLILGPMEIKIPEHFQQNIPELNIAEEIKTNDEIIYTNNEPYKLKLNIILKTAEKVYVRGWGVDTQLKGDLHVTGYADAPLINGRLNSIRGKYQEFGKSLTVKEGVLTFDGPVPPSPYLNIVGVSNVGSNEIRLVLSGPIEKPDITIQSTPSMSQEEALSMLLFGENPENISTFQALQLADGVRRLSGHGGGGFDPLGFGRKILGVDEISFKSDSENPENTSVGVGKHLSDKVYFEVEKGRQEGSTKTRIEVQITPKISIENITEQEGNTSFGINCRFDY
jgi:autotransporter translocation and assembly factor TamB